MKGASLDSDEEKNLRKTEKRSTQVTIRTQQKKNSDLVYFDI